MLLSVMTITYNHEPYIGQAIESFLAQKTTFDVEIVIGEDRSTDNTLQICLDYQKKYPGKIRVLSRDNNIGMMANMIDTFSQCKGKYIAVCEGDDYWTDPYKLQKQVDFLEKNEEYAICCHNVLCLSGNKKKKDNQWDAPDSSDISYLLMKGNFIPTLSAVYRNHIEILPFLKKMEKSPFGDYVLHIAASLNGKIKFLKEVMAIYRVHEQGVWTQLGKEKGLLKTLSMIELLHKNMNEDQQELLRIQFIGWIESIVRNKDSWGLFESEEFKKISNTLEVPQFIVKYMKFNIEQRGKRSYYSKYVPLPLLMGAVKDKLTKKIFGKA